MVAFWDRLRTRDEARQENNGIHLEEITPPVDDVLLKALLGSETIDRKKALTLPAVAGAVDFISNAVACMPVKLYKEKQGKVEEVKGDGRTKLLNGDTGDSLDAFQLKKAMVTDFLMGKGGYCYIRKYRNEVTGLFYVKDEYISFEWTKAPIINKDYQVIVDGRLYRPYEFIKLLRNTVDGASGVGLTEEISKELETAYQTLLYQLGMVKTGGNKRGFLRAERKLGAEEIDALKQAWRNMYGNNTESVVVLNNGLQFQEASNSSVEMQMNESKRTLTDEIYDLFHIYPNDFDRTFKEAIYPIVKAFETALNRDLLLEKEKKNHYFEFDVKEIIRASLTERYSAYKTAKETGFLTINEIRRAENLNWIEGLDVVNVGLGAVLYDVEKQKFFTPNTGEATDIESATQAGEDQKTQDMIISHEEAEAFDESGNSAERELRFNENHDPKTGRFSTGDGAGGSWDNKVSQMRSEYDALPNNKKAVYLWKSNFLSKEDSLKAMKSGEVDKYADEYFQVLKENGDYNPTGAVRDNSNRSEEMVRSGEYSNYTDARIALIMQDTGMGADEASQTYDELQTWFSNRWTYADTEVIDNYLAKTPAYDGVLYRGMHFDNADELDAFSGSLRAGDRLKMGDKNSSWTDSEETARLYAHNVDESYSSVMLVNTKNKTASPVADLSTQGEGEILAPSTAEWTVLRTETFDLPNGNKKQWVYLVEANTDEI